jgi:hypothetical protein
MMSAAGFKVVSWDEGRQILVVAEKRQVRAKVILPQQEMEDYL